MSSEKPGPGAIPGWGEQPPGEAAPSAPMPAQPSPGGAIPGWGQQPVATEPAPPAPASAPGSIPSAPPPPAATPTPGAGTTPGWGAGATPPPAPPMPPGQQPGWGGPPPAAPVAPGGTPPGAWNPAPAQSSGSSGCLKLALVLAVVAVLGFGLLMVAILFIGSEVAENVGVNPDGSVGKPCPFVERAELGAVLGSDARALVLDGLWDATLGIILDKRVLPTADDCWITADESTPTGRIAVHEGGDAADVFLQERQNAAPLSEDQGGGVSLTNEGWFAGDVSGLGDAAFCTGVSDAIQSGVLVRQGDRVVYVSLSGPADGPPAFETTEDGVIYAPAICELAQQVAREVLD